MKAVLQAAGFVQALGGAQVWVNPAWGTQRLWVLDKALNNAGEAELRKVFLKEHGPANQMSKLRGVK
jgi:hypothetical protein